MPESHGIPKTVIVSFMEHPVWDEIWKRMDIQLISAMAKAIGSTSDEPNRFEAGRYRALETIKNLPQLLIQELEKDTQPVSSQKRRKWL